MKLDNLLQQYVFWPEIENDFHKNINFSQTSLKNVVNKLFSSTIHDEIKNVQLEDYILKFYGYNEYLNNLRQSSHGFIEKKDIAIFNDYKNFLNDFSKKIFSYLLYCSISETMHYEPFANIEELLEDDATDSYIKSISKNKNSKKYAEYLSTYDDDDLKEYTYKEYLNEEYKYGNSSVPHAYLKNFYNNLQESLTFKKILAKFEIDDKDKDSFSSFLLFLIELKIDSLDRAITGEDGDLQRHTSYNKLLEKNNIGTISTEKFLTHLSSFFLKKFPDGFGGKAWSDITQHLLNFSTGNINAEMFLDRSLSLEHNTGHIFNKGFIFDNNYESSHSYWLDSNYNQCYLNFQQYSGLLNLQNSSSVFAFMNHEKLLELADPKNRSKISNFITLQLPQNKTIDKKQMTSIVKFIQDQASYFHDIFSNIYEPNKRFLQSLNFDKFKPASFNLNNFLVSFYKAKNNNTIANKVLETSFINNLFSDIYNYPSSLKIENKKHTQYNNKPVFHFHSLNHSDSKYLSKDDIGGKAYGLVELNHLGFPVPKAATFDTQTCLSYLANPNHFNQEFSNHSDSFKDYLKDSNGKPILVSVRSGASISMPGMMDTILNVGIDDTTYPLLVKQYDQKMINQCAISFMKQFTASRFNIHFKFSNNLEKALDQFTSLLIKNDIPCSRRSMFPLNIEQQLKESVVAVFKSWNSPRAISWRQEKHISHYLGTTATIQQMVFGNKNQNSFTCVLFSRDCITGKPELMGEYLEQAQGEALVSGHATPKNINELKKTNPDLYLQLKDIAEKLETHHQAIQDIEITVEDNQVYVLQKRNAVVSLQAQQALANEMGLDFTDYVSIDSILNSQKVDTIESPTYQGMSANPGIITGVIVKNKQDIEQYSKLKKSFIFLAEQALPEHAPLMINTQAFITELGGATSHAAILSRSMDKPCIVGLGKVSLKSGDIITMDAQYGTVWNTEQTIISDHINAELLATNILKAKKIEISNKNATFHHMRLESWFSGFVQEKEVATNNQFKNFLSISQKTAAIVLKEVEKKRLKFN